MSSIHSVTREWSRSAPPPRTGPCRPWIDFFVPAPRPQLRLFCFHHAGGSALMFRDWQRELPETIEICPVQMPGRGSRRSELSFTNLIEMSRATASGIQPFLDLPFAFFGYSMGAAVAFETARSLNAIGSGPIALVVSGAPAPHQISEPTDYWSRSSDVLIERLRSLNGTPEAILQNRELMDYMLAIIRADFQAVETYRADPAARISCPILAIAGTSDRHASSAAMKQWSELTTGPFSQESVEGDHSFVLRSSREVVALIRSYVREWAV